MSSSKSHIIAELQKQIMPLQGIRAIPLSERLNMGWGEIDQAFPNKSFPTAAIHEFISPDNESTAATSGFIAGIISVLMKNNGTAIWISNSRTLFPPALKQFAIAPEKIIFIDLKRSVDVLWAMEEALKCPGISAVVGELPELGFTASRRLQLAVEQSRVTGFALRRNLKNLTTTACLTRWKIEQLPSENEDGLPGIGFPKWKAELIKVRNGKPGTWEVTWSSGRFNLDKTAVKQMPAILKRNVG